MSGKVLLLVVVYSSTFFPVYEAKPQEKAATTPKAAGSGDQEGTLIKDVNTATGSDKKSVVSLSHLLKGFSWDTEAMGFMAASELINETDAPVELIQRSPAKESKLAGWKVRSKGCSVTILEDGSMSILLAPEGRIAALCEVRARKGETCKCLFFPMAEGSENINVTVQKTFVMPDGRKYNPGKYKLVNSRLAPQR